MNTIVNVPAAPRAGARTNGGAHEEGDGVAFQLALGLAAASQSRPPEPVTHDPVADSPGEEEAIVAHDGETQDDAARGESSAIDDEAEGSRAPQATPRAESVRDGRHEPRAREAAEAPGTAQNAASPAPATAQDARATGTRITTPASAALHAVPAAPLTESTASGERFQGGLAQIDTASGESVPEGVSARVVAAKLATPQAPTPPRVSRLVTPSTASGSGSPVPASSATGSDASAGATTKGHPAVTAATPPAPRDSGPAGPTGAGNDPTVPGAHSTAEAASAAPEMAAGADAPRRVATTATFVVAARPASDSSAAAEATGPGRGAARTDLPAPTEPSAPAAQAARPTPVDAAPIAGSSQGGSGATQREASGDRSAGRDDFSHSFAKTATEAAPVTQSSTASAPAPAPAVAANAAHDVATSPASGGAARIDAQAANLANASTAVQDPRLEPMRRVADQVTLQFQGEAGLEGRLRISVRGDSVRAAILSSHDGTLQRAGGEMNALKRALAEQGFTDAKVTVQDTRALASSSAGASREQSQSGADRRQGEPRERQSQGRETRQDGGSSNRGRRESRDERRDA